MYITIRLSNNIYIIWIPFWKQKATINIEKRKTKKSHLINVSSNNKDRRARCMATYGAEPKIQAGVLTAKSDIPDQYVQGPRRQKELVRIVIDTLTREIPHVVSECARVQRCIFELFGVLI
jgi:hypothetical protein